MSEEEKEWWWVFFSNFLFSSRDHKNKSQSDKTWIKKQLFQTRAGLFPRPSLPSWARKTMRWHLFERWNETEHGSLSLSLSLSHSSSLFRKSHGERSRRERNQRKSALLEKRDHTRSKKNYILRGIIHFLPYAYPLERMCLRTSSVAPCVKST